MILSQKFYLRIFTRFSMSGVNFAYHSYEKPLRTAHSKKYFRHLTPIYIFLGPDIPNNKKKQKSLSPTYLHSVMAKDDAAIS